MTEQLVQSKTAAQRLTLVILAMMMIALAMLMGWYLQQISDPYVQQVLALPGDISRGHAMFEINCAGCHGIQADGSVGPNLHHVQKRRSKISLIYQVTSGKTPPMPKFQPSTQEMADLLSYLENL